MYAFQMDLCFLKNAEFLCIFVHLIHFNQIGLPAKAARLFVLIDNGLPECIDRVKELI
jgi:hypothetical protein